LREPCRANFIPALALLSPFIVHRSAFIVSPNSP
jgi:hypothetical protein